MENQIVVFGVGPEQFGVQIVHVESIIKMQPITQLPHVSHFVEGVTNLRGKVLPVIDLRKRFGLDEKQTDKNNRIIVVRVDHTEVGMIVDNVTEVLTVQDGDIEASPAIASNVDTAFITGIAKLDPHLVILLDLRKILSIHGAEAPLETKPQP